MQSHAQISSSAQLFLGKLKTFLESSGLSIHEFFANFETINNGQLSKLEFFRIVSLFNIDTLANFDPHLVFNQLSRKQETIDLAYFKKLFSALGSQVNDRKISQEKAREDEMKKKIIRIGIYKLQEFIRNHPNPYEMLKEFDTDRNGGLNKSEFSSFLVATDIKQFASRDIRRMLVEQIFRYVAPRTQMTMHELAKFFKIEPRKKEVKPEIVNIPHIVIPEIKPPVKPPPIPAVSPPQVNILPQNVSPGKLQVPKPFGKKGNLNEPVYPGHHPIKQTQEIDIDNQISNFANSYPRALKFYRLGEPDSSEHSLLQMLEELLAQGKTYEDKSNPAISQGEYLKAVNIFKTNRFFIFQMASSVLLREKSRIGIAREIQPKDIIQGSVGDCYFLSSIASIISIYPQLIAERIPIDINPAGLCAAKLFIDGEWKTIFTDDRFPCRSNGQPLFAKPHNNEIWVMLLEKCWAKEFGSFKAIESGSSKEGFIALTGAPCELVSHEEEKGQIQLIKQLELAHAKRYVATMSGSAYLESLGKRGEEQLGLISGHAYSLLKIIKIGGQTLVKLRNPWGKTIWKGQWSFESPLWTKELRDKFNYNRSPDDGSFYMPWRQFCKYFGEVVICKLNPTYMHDSIRLKTARHKSGYLMLKIKTPGQYIISIYQQNKRKFANTANYEYSQSRLIILRKNGNELTYVKSSSKSQAQVCSLDLELEAGEYIVSAKAVWKFWQNHEMVVTSYGTDHVSWAPINRAIAPAFKEGLIRSYARTFAGKGKVKSYEKYGFNATCETNFDIETGIGYIRMVNNSEKGFESTQQMKVTGIKAIKPDKLPLHFIVTPKYDKIVGFFVSSAGYEYSSSERIKY